MRVSVNQINVALTHEWDARIWALSHIALGELFQGKIRR
jgi:hypothetical protein